MMIMTIKQTILSLTPTFEWLDQYGNVNQSKKSLTEI